MIALKRERTADAVHTNFRGARRVELNLELMKLKRDGKLEESINKVLKSDVWKKAKDQLLRESKDKCAYCETPTKVVAFGDVEHFRPKSIYWWLAYCYENYLASCAMCNQKYKADNFRTVNQAMPAPVQIKAADTDALLATKAPLLTVDPVDDSRGMPIQDFEAAMAAEYALLIHPYFEDPAEYLAYKPVLESKEIFVVPLKAEHEPIVNTCDEFFGINRKELRDLRFQWYILYMTIKHTLAVPNLPVPLTTSLKNRITEMKASFSGYAGMIRYFETQPLSSLPWDFNLVIAD